MGIFSRKSFKKPIPKLAITLDHPPDKVFHPNDTITGHLKLTTPLPLNPQALHVVFSGTSSTWIRHSTKSATNNVRRYWHYRDEAALFSVVADVLHQHGAQQTFESGQEYTFPFRFVVPEGTRTERIGVYKKDNDARWTISPHKLPPTCFFTDDGREGPSSAEIAYGVTGTLVCPGLQLKGGDVLSSSTVRITFAPSTTTVSSPSVSTIAHEKHFKLKFSHVDPENNPSLLHRLTHLGSPTLPFIITLHAPATLASGTEFNFRVSALLASCPSTSSLHINFKVQRLDLVSFTSIRAAQDWLASNTMDGEHDPGDYYTRHEVPKYKHEQHEYWENKVKLNAVPEVQSQALVMRQHGKEKGGYEGYCEAQFTARVPGYTAPAFRSFAIARGYILRVKMRAEVAGKKFNFEVKSFVGEMGGPA